MLKLIRNQPEFAKFIASVNWNSSYVKEVHYSCGEVHYTSELGKTNISTEENLLRALIVLPEQNQLLELVGFNAKYYTLTPKNYLDERQDVVIKRRKTELDLGALSVTCGCLGFQILPPDTVQNGPHYSDIPVFDNDGNALAPYDINWRLLLDEQTQVGKAGEFAEISNDEEDNSKQIAQEEIDAVCALSPEERYARFINETAKTDELWGLYHEDLEEWATTRTDDDKWAMPVWPHKKFAELCCIDEWKAHKPKAVDLGEFLDLMLPIMALSGVAVIVFPLPACTGITPAFEQLMADIDPELNL